MILISVACVFGPLTIIEGHGGGGRGGGGRGGGIGRGGFGGGRGRGFSYYSGPSYYGYGGNGYYDNYNVIPVYYPPPENYYYPYFSTV